MLKPCCVVECCIKSQTSQALDRTGEARIIMMVTLLLLLAAASSVFLGYSKTIVISQNGTDDSTCLEKPSHPCRSLDYAARHLSENVVYQVDGASVLESTVVFNASNITIVGSSGSSKLVCPQNCSTCGLAFLHCRLVALRNVAITGCGTVGNFSSQGEGLQYKSAVILDNCSDVSLVNITVRDSRGYGVVLFNSAGEVTVSHSHFLSSTMPSDQEVLGGAGMRIVVSFCDIVASSCNKTQRHVAHYSITHSVFKDSNVTRIFVKPWLTREVEDGGGLGILLWWGAHKNTITITNSTFAGNHCPRGAGASLMCNMDSADNQILVRNSTFCNNSALTNPSSIHVRGGAGASVGIASDNYQSFPHENNIIFENCHFSQNTGYYGTGTLVYGAAAVKNHTPGSNRLHFTGCSWERNTGVVSSALDIGPDFFGTYKTSFIVNISFNNCNFSNNYVSNLHNSHYHSALGVLLIAQFHVYFSGNTRFENNQGSALAVFSAHIVFNDGSVTTFISNTGRARGGALVLFDYSTLRYWNNTQFKFTDNKSLFMGGAIYVTKYSEHEQFSSRSCFIHYGDEYVYNKVDFHRFLNVSFIFENNTAGYGFAHSIYANSVRPCQHFCSASDVHEVFSNQSCLGHFRFDNRSHQIGTEGTNFTFNPPPPYKMIPGHKHILPINITDEFENNAVNITNFQSHVNSTDISIDPAYLFVTNNTVAIDGNPDSKGDLFLIGTRSNEEIRVEIQLVPCAPGYVAKPGSNGIVKCVCSAIYRDAQYRGIVGCNDSAGKALIVPGMWAGYVSKNANEHSLYTGFCVHGYCKDFIAHTKSMKPFELNSSASQNELNKIMCAQNRHGILCGNCTANHSVYYHSSTFSCRSNRLCAVGFIFYILSELLPAAILLLLILFLNINLTSGTAYSLIFMVNILQAMGFSYVSEPGFQSTLIDIAMMIYSTLNLEFFSLETFAYCLWAGASALDILIMKYATVLYAFGLVVFTVLMVRYCNRCRHLVYRRSHISFVQGLSALLVISYSQCVLVAFYTLNLSMITGMGGIPYKTALVYVDGTVPYFSPDHLKYAIPALLVLTIIVIPISVILVGDQYFLRLEYIINQCCCPGRHIYPYTQFREKFRPLFDSFQGCFKDEYRFMSGLFFIYRIIFLLVLVVTPRLDWFYGLVQLVLVIILTIHALLQPFQETKHNVLAVLVFFMLSLINCFSIIKYLFMYSDVNTDAVYVFQWFRLILIYLPIIIGAGWVCLCIWRALKRAYNRLRHDYFEISDEQANSDESSGIPLDRL